MNRFQTLLSISTCDASFQINFKLELPSLSCEWATVDVIDALGSRQGLTLIHCLLNLRSACH
jgi:hypothetical protein